MVRDPGLRTVVQIAIVCRDVEATAKKWAEFLGVERPGVSMTAPGNQCGMIYRGKDSDARCKLVFFDLGSCQLELIEPVGSGSSWQELLDKNGESVHHIGFKVSDVEETVDGLKEMGMPVIHQGHWEEKNGTYAYLDSRAQLGVMVELLNYRKK